MNIVIKNKIVNFKEVDYSDLFELVKKSNYKNNFGTSDFPNSLFNFKNNHNFSMSSFQYANLDQLTNLNEDLERTRRVHKRIYEYIPKKILQIELDQRTLDKQSFRLTKEQYKKSNKIIKTKLKKYKYQSREYKIEIKIRIRYVYKIYSSIIPSLYIIKRPSYGIVQCKWKFLGITQKQMHLGTFKKIGLLEDRLLKEKAIIKINKNYSNFFYKLTFNNINAEKKKLFKWCKDINYRMKK